MAKQQRMALMTIACIAPAVLSWPDLRWPVVAATLVLIGIGSAITVLLRFLASSVNWSRSEILGRYACLRAFRAACALGGHRSG